MTGAAQRVLTERMPRLLKPAEEAALLQVPERTLADWRHRRTGPPWIRVGRHVRYPEDGTVKWLTAKTVTP